MWLFETKLAVYSLYAIREQGVIQYKDAILPVQAIPLRRYD